MEENIGFKKEIFASEQKSNYDQEALKSLCQQVLDNHNELKSKLKASTDIENDCQFVLPKLLGQVMKLSNGKANSTQAKEAISELLGNHLIEKPKDHDEFISLWGFGVLKISKCHPPKNMTTKFYM